MSKVVLEICVDGVGGAKIAEQSGADRLELCAALELGGLTPTYGTLATLREDSSIPIFVLIRPRAGDFVYSRSEISTMLKDIEICKSLGASGFVIGALDSQARLNGSVLRELVSAANGCDTTLHRAFDHCADLNNALEDAVDIGFTRILTSGGFGTVIEGQYVLQRLHRQADNRIRILPGGGLLPSNVTQLLHRVPANEVHASCKKVSPIESEANTVSLGVLDVVSRHQTDPGCVRAMVRALEDIQV